MVRIQIYIAAATLIIASVAGASAPTIAATGGVTVSTGPEFQARLQKALEAEQEVGQHPSMAMAVFDRSGITWSGYAGFADAARQIKAGPETLYRAGSVSKLFTDIMLIQLVEEGRVDLDAPVTRYLPAFRPINRFKTAITLRHLLGHTSGLVREPPVGSYFEIGDPGSAAIVASLNKTALVAEPGSVRKYSNAGLAVVGAIVEAAYKRDYDSLVLQKLLRPAGMKHSKFVVAGSAASLAFAQTTDSEGTRGPAPVFEIGLKAAGGLNTTVPDLARFGTALLRGGKGISGALLSPTALATMYQSTPAKSGSMSKIGLGFVVRDLNGERMVGHSGGIYGYTAEFWLLPDRGVGVIAFGTVDGDDGPYRLARRTLQMAVAQMDNAPLPIALGAARQIDLSRQRQVEGHYASPKGSLEIRSIDRRLMVETPQIEAELVDRGGTLELLGPLGSGKAIALDADAQWVQIGDTRYTRLQQPKPPEPEPSLRSLFGDYGWDHEYIRVYERDGQPYVTIEWLDHSAMRMVDANTLAFADDALLYAREQLVFTRDASGRGASISLNGIVFKRREDRTPVVATSDRPAARARIAGLIAAARTATPPSETGKIASDLVAVRTVDPSLKLDIRYATEDNFLGVAVYNAPVAMLQRPAAEALKRVNVALRAYGYGLLIHDAYRPWYVTKVFWDATPLKDRLFVANPAEGSRHNRGGAVDLSLVDLSTGLPVEMPGDYDETSDRSAATYVGGSARQRWHRDLLRRAMEAEGFAVYSLEWWHFDYKDWPSYPIGNFDLG